MKKLIAVVLALCLACGVAAVAAGEELRGESNQTVIKGQVDEHYLVVIQPSVTIPFANNKTLFPVEVRDFIMEPAQAESDVRAVQVTADKLAGELVNGNGNALPYTVELDGGVDPGSGEKALLFAESAAKDMSINITTDDWNRAAGGEYTDTLTFTFKIVEVDSGLF